MARADRDDITTALKAALATIDGLSAWAGEPPSPKCPAAWVVLSREPAGEFVTNDGGMRWHVNVVVAVQAADPMHFQRNLQPYLAYAGDKSIREAIESDPSLGLPGVYATVLRIEAIGRVEFAGTSAWGARFPIDIDVSAV